MANIAKMFFQVRVAEHSRSFLRYLWWPNGDLYSQPIDYEINVHVFGASSSPSCSNYALRRTVHYNEGRYPRTIVNFFKYNIYVNDLLKSLKREKKAIKFVP